MGYTDMGPGSGGLCLGSDYLDGWGKCVASSGPLNLKVSKSHSKVKALGSYDHTF